MRALISIGFIFLTTHCLLGQNEIADSTKNRFVENHYLNFQGGLGFFNNGYEIIPDADLRLFFGRKISRFLNPGIAVGYDVLAPPAYNLIPVSLNFRIPISKQFYINAENGYGIPVAKSHIDKEQYHGRGGYSTGFSIGSASQSDIIKWHVSIGFKYQYHEEEWTPPWSELPNRYEYKMHRFFVRVGLGI